MLTNGEAGIDCGNCGGQEIVTTEDKSELLSKSLGWSEGGDPFCPGCGNTVVYEHYLDSE